MDKSMFNSHLKERKYTKTKLYIQINKDREKAVLNNILLNPAKANVRLNYDRNKYKAKLRSKKQLISLTFVLNQDYLL